MVTGGWFMVYDWVYYMINICHQPVEGNDMSLDQGAYQLVKLFRPNALGGVCNGVWRLASGTFVG